MLFQRVFLYYSKYVDLISGHLHDLSLMGLLRRTNQQQTMYSNRYSQQYLIAQYIKLFQIWTVHIQWKYPAI